MCGGKNKKRERKGRSNEAANWPSVVRENLGGLAKSGSKLSKLIFVPAKPPLLSTFKSHYSPFPPVTFPRAPFRSFIFFKNKSVAYNIQRCRLQ